MHRRTAFVRASLAGLACVVVPVAALLIAVRGQPPVSADERGAAARLSLLRERAPAAGDLTSLRAARRIARQQLRTAARELRACRQPRRTEAWRDCVRWPLAHLAVAGRASAATLYFTGQRLAPGGCGEQPMGEASGLRLVGGNADQLVRELANDSRQAREERRLAFASTAALIGDLRRQLGRPLRGC